MAHGVLALPTPSRRPDLDERFIDAVRHEFANVTHRQVLPPEAPPNTPHLTLASTSSQLVLSGMQADFEVRFYGDYLGDLSKCLDYIARKLNAMLAGFAATDRVPATVGLITTLWFSFRDLEIRPAEHILATHLKTQVDPASVQDAVARVAVKVDDKYFLNLTASNYESRVFSRTLIPGMQHAIAVKAWEGTIDDTGVELAVDINNGLEARSLEADPTVTENGMAAVVRLLEKIALSVGPAYVQNAQLDLDAITAGASG